MKVICDYIYQLSITTTDPSQNIYHKGPFWTMFSLCESNMTLKSKEMILYSNWSLSIRIGVDKKNIYIIIKYTVHNSKNIVKIEK